MRTFHGRLAGAVLATLIAASACQSAKPAQDADASGDARLDWWREARFGMFIHWGLYAVPAGEWGTRKDHGEWIYTTAQIPLERYEQFRNDFNPVKFDAERWVQIAKSAGMKYITITSKHHDGFCLFDSKFTDYDVMSTPFRRDILKELAEACRKHGIRLCFYHSIMDWHHPDYLPRREWEKRSAAGANMDRYVEHLHNQVRELLTEYGDIGVMWFDGEWESTWNHKRGKALYELCRSVKPDVIVNNRVDVGRGGMAGMTKGSEYCGDFGTPEQEIPATGFSGVDWETCMTLNDHWGYCRADQNWKSSEQLIRMLCDIASKGGNYLLNVGPTAEGEIPGASVERLQAMGRWTATNGEALYGTTASVFDALPWGRCTVRRSGARTRLYFHVFDWPADGKLSIPGLGSAVERAWLLADPKKALSCRTADGSVSVEVPRSAPDAIASVVAVEVSGEPIVYKAPTIEAAADQFVATLPVRIAGSPGLDVRVTLDGSEPSRTSMVAGDAIVLRGDATIAARAFHGGRPVSPVVRRAFKKVVPKPARHFGALEPGILCEIVEGKFERIPAFKHVRKEVLPVPAVPADEWVARRFLGVLEVPADDLYEFSLISDDGSRLSIDGEVVIDHDGPHAPSEKRGHAPLAAGKHEIVLEWFNAAGGAELQLRWARVGEALQPIPAAAFSHSK
ncbi:MAG: alpha-L-fucosidase [Planctomycetes bacterium]|nr:alpha-L-fucosidase [Planctomycetota bacterium]